MNSPRRQILSRNGPWLTSDEKRTSLLHEFRTNKKVTEFRASRTTPAAFPERSTQPMVGSNWCDWIVDTVLNGRQEIPTPPEYPFDRKTQFGQN